MAQPGKIPSPDPSTTGTGCLVRLGWMFLGTATVVLSALVISQYHGFLSAADAVFWAAIAGCIALRYIDIRWMNGQTATAEPATMRHWRRYVLLIVGVGLVVWGAAHGIAYLSR